ncbi:hypothetical protein K438DRAFT_2031188 [Mycena galopus ATCC 62051]|nr:hypothetical protein K438DRAFT_2031188 [Mycena galopus ATCC 62051]
MHSGTTSARAHTPSSLTVNDQAAAVYAVAIPRLACRRLLERCRELLQTIVYAHGSVFSIFAEDIGIFAGLDWDDALPALKQRPASPPHGPQIRGSDLYPAPPLIYSLPPSASDAGEPPAMAMNSAALRIRPQLRTEREAKGSGCGRRATETPLPEKKLTVDRVSRCRARGTLSPVSSYCSLHRPMNTVYPDIDEVMLRRRALLSSRQVLPPALNAAALDNDGHEQNETCVSASLNDARTLASAPPGPALPETKRKDTTPRPPCTPPCARGSRSLRPAYLQHAPVFGSLQRSLFVQHASASASLLAPSPHNSSIFSILEAPSAAHQLLIKNTQAHRNGAETILARIDSIANLVSLLPTVVAEGTEDDKIFCVITTIQGPGGVASTFNRCFEILFKEDAQCRVNGCLHLIRILEARVIGLWQGFPVGIVTVPVQDGGTDGRTDNRPVPSLGCWSSQHAVPSPDGSKDGRPVHRKTVDGRMILVGISA